MAAKGHPWLFVRFVVLSGRMVRRPLEYLQRPMCSENSASYISVFYILVPPLSSHTAAEIIAKVTGIAPLHDVAVLHLVAGATVVGIPAVDVVHPAGQTAHVELIEVVDTLYIRAVVHGCPVGLHVNSVVTAYALEYIEYTFAVAERYLCGWKDDTVLRYKGFLALSTLIHIVQNRLAGDGYSAGILCVRIHVAVLRLYRCRFTLRHRVGHVLILVAGILRLFCLRLATGSTK